MSKPDPNIGLHIAAKVIRGWIAKRLDIATGNGWLNRAQLWGECLDAFDRACATLPPRR